MEFLTLVWVNLVVTVKSFIEYLKVVYRYYGNSLFRKEDLALLRRYLFKSPYRISKNFLSEQGADDVYAYGETPLTSMALLAQECRIASTDTVFELGCGRGRTCFWLNAFKGCRVVGIEFIPELVDNAEAVRRTFDVSGVEFRLEDMLKSDLSSATVVYFYGTSYDDAFIKALVEKLEKLPKGTRVVTVSYALEEYDTDKFVTKRCFPIPFTWGVGDVYLQEKV